MALGRLAGFGLLGEAADHLIQMVAVVVGVVVVVAAAVVHGLVPQPLTTSVNG